MATDAASASASLGPRYAPEDPTLIKPWKGLIDGTTGVKYYWNPESNVTQYERPADPLSAPGVPPSASVPKLAPIPAVHSFQNNGSMTQLGQEMNQSYQSHGQQTFQPQQTHYNPQQPTPQFGEDTQQHQVTQGVHQQQIQQMPQGVQQNWYPMSQQSRDQPIQQPGQRMPQHLEQQTWQHEVQQPSHLQGQQFPNQQQQIPFHGSLSMQGKQTLQPQTHQSTYQQGPQVSFSPREEPEFQRGKESGFSQSSIQQPGLSFFQDRPQTGTPPVQSQQQGSDAVHQHNMGRPMFQPHQGSTNIHDQRPGVPPMGSKMGYGDDLHGRSGNEFYFNPNKGSVVAPQSKMAPGPLPQNQMEMELRHHVISGHANGSNSAMAHMKNPVVGAQTFAHKAAGVPPVIHGSLDGTELSAADAYRREHEISATSFMV